MQEASRNLDADIGEAFFGLLGRQEPRFYSTDYEAAFAVLDKLHQQTWFWRLDSVMGGVICTVQKIVGDIQKPNPERQTFQVGAATVPLAICLAALKTCGKSKKV